MARDFLTIGSSPSGEGCVQVGATNYHCLCPIEIRAFLNQIHRQMPPPAGSSARVAGKSFPHDFGTYTEVVAYYDDQDEAAVDYAFKLEAETPEYWDAEAKAEILEACGKLGILPTPFAEGGE